MEQSHKTHFDFPFQSQVYKDHFKSYKHLAKICFKETVSRGLIILKKIQDISNKLINQIYSQKPNYITNQMT